MKTFRQLRNHYVSPAIPFSVSKSFSCTFLFLLPDLVPLKQTRAVHRMAKDTFVLIHVIVVAWFSCFFEEMSSARLEWYRWHSWDIPPVVVNAKGVKVPFSTSIILDACFRFFSSSCNLYICLGLSSLHESAFGWHARISIKAASCHSQNPRQCTSRCVSAAVFAPLLSSSPTRGCKVGSIATS